MVILSTRKKTEAAEEDPSPLGLVLHDFMLKFGNLEDKKKETGQSKTQEMCNKAVEEEPTSLWFVPDHFKTQEMFKKAIEQALWVL